MPSRDVKVCVVGSMGVGKTCLLERFVNDTFHLHTSSTLACSFLDKTVVYGDYIIKFNIWDTCGQERFRSITPSFYRNAHGVIILYDIISSSCFNEMKSWVDEVKSNAPKNVVLAIIGNKNDLKEQRQVSMETGHNFADNIGAMFLETSAESGENIDLLFQLMAEKILNNQPESSIVSETVNVTVPNNNNNNNNSKCNKC